MVAWPPIATGENSTVQKGARLSILALLRRTTTPFTHPAKRSG
jgi:hypothetical protein